MQPAIYTSIAAQCSISSSSLRVASQWSCSSSTATPPSQIFRSLSSLDSFSSEKFLWALDSARLNVEPGEKKLAHQGLRSSYNGRQDKRDGESGKKSAGRIGKSPTGETDNRKVYRGRDDDDIVFVKRFQGDADEVNFRADWQGDYRQPGGSSRPVGGTSGSNGPGRDTDMRGTGKGTRIGEGIAANDRWGSRKNNAAQRQGDSDIEGEADDNEAEGERKLKYSDERQNSEKKKRVKEPPISPQVRHERLMSKDPEVAIIGGGMAGLVCALTLEKLGVRSTVFDTVSDGLTLPLMILEWTLIRPFFGGFQ